MSDVVDIYPADKFHAAAHNSTHEVECGIIIGYDDGGDLCVYGGGLINGKRPTQKDWLWMVESFKTKLMNGDYAEE